MEKQRTFVLVRALILATLLVSGVALARDEEPRAPAKPAETLPSAALAPLGTGFTYQGQLVENGSPVNDDCEMAFRLYDEATGGVQVGSAITATVPITDGLFAITLDFGAGAFIGDRRWLGIEVDCEEDSTYADLGRQELTAAPYALYTMGAPWSGLTSVPAGFADGVDDDTTYSAGLGLTLDGTTFDVVTSTIQQRVTGICGTGYAIRQVNADGSVICEQDDDTDTTYTAGDGLVLDGTEFSAQGSSYANVVVVAKSGGDHTSVQAAIDSITDAAEGNPYLVWVAPGVYSETVTMKPYVHLQGAGQEATVITSTVSSSSWPPSQATLVLTRNTSLRDLTVDNGGTGSRNTALLATAGTTRTRVIGVTARAQGEGMDNYAVFLTGGDTGVTLQHVTGLSESDNYNYGLFNFSGSNAVLRGGSFTGRGGDETRGICNFGGATLEAENVIVLGENGNYNFGLDNTGDVILRGGSFTGRGGSIAQGIRNILFATLEAEDVTALAENGSIQRYGLLIEQSASAKVNRSRFMGSPYSLYQTGGTVHLGVTHLDGGVFRSGTSTTLTCFQVYDENYAPYTCP